MSLIETLARVADAREAIAANPTNTYVLGLIYQDVVGAHPHDDDNTTAALMVEVLTGYLNEWEADVRRQSADTTTKDTP